MKVEILILSVTAILIILMVIKHIIIACSSAEARSDYRFRGNKSLNFFVKVNTENGEY